MYQAPERFEGFPRLQHRPIVYGSELEPISGRQSLTGMTFGYNGQSSTIEPMQTSQGKQDKYKHL